MTIQRALKLNRLLEVSVWLVPPPVANTMQLLPDPLKYTAIHCNHNLILCVQWLDTENWN